MGTPQGLRPSKWNRTAFMLAPLAGLLLTPCDAGAQLAATGGVHPNRAGQIAGTLRYRPDREGGFVIENGTERFNRPLYGGNTAFRVDGGDAPEFVLYLPGRGGNLRLAVEQRGHAPWWLHEARSIVTRYLPGELRYEIRDPRLGEGVLRITVLAYRDIEGMVLQAETTHDAGGTRLRWAYGGVNGQRGKRDGDIGTEAVPISQWFALKPEFAEGNRVTPDASGFTLAARPATIGGTLSHGTIGPVASAEDWDSAARLFAGATAAAARPVVTGTLDLGATPSWLSLQVLGRDAGRPRDLADYREVSKRPQPAAADPAPLPRLAPAQLAHRFAETRAAFAALRGQVRIDTPDPYLNAAMAALNIAADAVWDGPQQSIMHGAIAWRTRLLGWRGPYALDALGWHDRARANIRGWLANQNVEPIPVALPPPDEDSNLARSEAALHSNGDLSRSHYDMNSVFIDALLRHLAWTGDMALAREAWPVIERHLAWQRRLFRRPIGPEGLPLYEAYAQIWASDDIGYGGGGVAYASAYNLFANREAARLAQLLGKDGSAYAAEADAIGRAMRAALWLPDRGHFAEYRDTLGERQVHPSAGLWSFYHVVDSRVPDAGEAWRMAAAVLRDMPRLPVTGPGVPGDRPHAMFSTTDWMPYSWSVNNVVMGENAHAALGLWQAGWSESAFTLARSAILASMFMGITPGNVGTLNYLDVYRRESQRDFADGAGVLSRALVEGLFGLRPDALARTLRIEPGLPRDWDHAAIAHPSADFAYRRSGDVERYTVGDPRHRFDRILLRLPARRETLLSATADGKPAAWTVDASAIGHPALLIALPASAQTELVLRWSGAAIDGVERDGTLVPAHAGAFSWRQPSGPGTRVTEAPLPSQRPPTGAQDPVDMRDAFNDRLTAIFAKGKYRGPRSAGASLALPAQGIGGWAGHVNASATIDDSGLRARAAGGEFALPDGGRFRLPPATDAANAAFVSQWSNYPRDVTVKLTGKARYLRLLMAGSTNPMQSRIDNGEVVVTYRDGGTARLPLRNPTSWWPIEQDYLIDDYQFRAPGERPLRVDLRTGAVRVPTGDGKMIDGGAATVLGLPLDPARPLASVTIRALAQEVVIGTLGMTLVR
ncbi:hypothetical protein FHS95_002752 [Sphingomonas naasensis]|uniref:DUF4450 domain-containing protein n=1 Tax=Sphingomonas naasensis TaxID=1344951 RepID=A0A4S1WQ85_9SPHN|nr:DUF4450 domain-containing protein [Sphingomonas naasensis]NIJ21060.1 hypothetical protein [Sphingomonas naasensis]TGX43436.1 DUF4450 domain-containing protein [Sphingomonas naasensis]